MKKVNAPPSEKTKNTSSKGNHSRRKNNGQKNIAKFRIYSNGSWCTLNYKSDFVNSRGGFDCNRSCNTGIVMAKKPTNPELLKLLHERTLELLQGRLAIILGGIATGLFILTNLETFIQNQHIFVPLLILIIGIIYYTWNQAMAELDWIELQFGAKEKQGIFDSFYSFLNKHIDTSAALLEVIYEVLMIATVFLIAYVVAIILTSI